MLLIDTVGCATWARKFSGCLNSAGFEHADMNSVHIQIQKQLRALIQELSDTAGDAEAAEENLLESLRSAEETPSNASSGSGLQWFYGDGSFSFSGLGTSNAKKNSSLLPKLAAGLEAGLMKYEKEADAGRLTNVFSAKIAAFTVESECKAYLYDEKGRLDPGLAAKAEADASLVKLENETEYSFGFFSLADKLVTSVCTLYAGVDAEIGADGVKAKGEAGAAVFIQEGSLTIDLIFAEITIGGSFSLFCAEAGYEGELTTTGASIGLKAGAVVGVGVSLSFHLKGPGENLTKDKKIEIEKKELSEPVILSKNWKASES